LPLDYGIVGKTIRENACQVVENVQISPDFGEQIDQMTGFVTRTILCAPMEVRGRILGAIELINKCGGENFSLADQRALLALAAAAGLSLENARHAKALIQHNRILRELELAADLQRSLLPPPRAEAFPVCGVLLPSATVSGDFFDIVPLVDGRIAFAVADVAGKGMNAALLMAKTAGLFRLLTGHGLSPGRVLAGINREICESSVYGLFVSMIVGEYRPATDSVCFANAGHVPPILVTTSRVRILPTDDPPLGILYDHGCCSSGEGGKGKEEDKEIHADFDSDLNSDSNFETFSENTVELQDGAFHIVSDSVARLPTGDGKGLGMGGILALLSRIDAVDSQERLSRLLDVLPLPHGFQGTPPSALNDDITLLVVADANR
jgi:sigma-B regulation protein RsbU (phosphoserine phosphatase)